MIAYMMVFMGLPVYGGVIAMMAVGFLIPFVIGEYLSSAFEWYNEKVQAVYYSIPRDWMISSTEDLGDGTVMDHTTWLGDAIDFVFRYIVIPDSGFGMIVFVMFAYMVLEILFFAFLMIGRKRSGKRVPDIKQDF